MTQPPDAVPSRPEHVVLVILDSLNRHLLGAYGSSEFDTPVLDAFAAESLRFTRHYAGSLPCMPARHDMLCGALDFLWRPWGSVEVWEDPITWQLRRDGVTTMLVTDHPHLFETGGENYHTDFGAWTYLRGHESDAWRTRPDPSWAGAPALPAEPGWVPHHYDTSRTWFRTEADFPGPKTMHAAAAWIRDEAPRQDRFLLVVDEFDPHEPFDTPEPYASRYGPVADGSRLIWPPYAVDAVARGVLTAEQAVQLRAAYGSKLTMIDTWLGELLGAIDAAGLRDDTAVVITTDHGHYLGERDIWGKPGVPIYDEMGHLPLLVRWPSIAPGDVDALTCTVDVHATLCDVFGVEPQHRTHGRSFVPLVDGTATAIRDHALMGIWGREVHVTDGRRKYVRGSTAGNRPLAMWSNRWSTMPIPAFPDIRLPRPDGRARLATMPGSTVPVIRQPFGPDDPVPFWAEIGPDPTRNLLFDLRDDPGEEHDRSGSPAESDAVDLLRDALDGVEAPAEQLERLGLD
jgi:arylsulfatase A-like enzyme